MSDRIVTAAVIIIGNEILSGRTQDTNLRDIALKLGEWGVRIAEARVIPDVAETIAGVVNELRAKHDYVLTTGGIGPTHDDVTAQSIARAFGVPLVEHPEIAALLRARGGPPDVVAARMRMALVPQGAELVENSTGGPPGFRVGNVFVLAGIPSVMRAMLASLQDKLVGGAVLKAKSVGVLLGESAIADALGKLQNNYPEVEIGSYPFQRDGRYGTTLVARATDEALLDEVMTKIAALIVEAGGQPLGGDGTAAH
jgi:molybdenum cofactor synthesis domain-containing protein